MRALARGSAVGVACWLFGIASSLSGDVRRVFVTSVSGDAVLGDWPGAGAATGLAAGDAICQARAVAGGLPNASGYRAWLSSSTTDAYCRVHGLSGEKSSNCGQPSLPVAAGPWRRVDDVRFGAALPDLLDPANVVLLPPRIDESGSVVHAGVWTGTVSTGVGLDSMTCANWTSSAGGNGLIGSSDATSGNWTSAYNSSCANTHHLLCVEIGVGDPLPIGGSWGRLAFVTSVEGTGNLASWPQAGGQSGLVAGDTICRNLATAAGLPNPTTFKAWLSTGAADARDRFVHDGPWMRLDRVRVANDLADLTNGFLRTPFNVDETGVYESVPWVWTGTAEDGSATGDHCSGWTNGTQSASGQFGRAAFADGNWTDAGSFGCANPYRLYCLQDLPLVFGDGFESGNTGLWSAAVP